MSRQNYSQGCSTRINCLPRCLLQKKKRKGFFGHFLKVLLLFFLTCVFRFVFSFVVSFKMCGFCVHRAAVHDKSLQLSWLNHAQPVAGQFRMTTESSVFIQCDTQRPEASSTLQRKADIKREWLSPMLLLNQETGQHGFHSILAVWLGTCYLDKFPENFSWETKLSS